MSATVRIAMWSGPRNISTAMMRSFENRVDCTVSDEPFYGAYLQRTGLDHPLADAVIADMECDYATVAKQLLANPPGAATIWYQKHMSHHMLPQDDLSWTRGVVNCFLIRRPEEMIASYAQKRSNPTREDFGVDRQAELFDLIRDETGKTPPVLDTADILRDPKAALTALCTAIGIGFDPGMLSWPLGKRDSDGVWADVWYGNVMASTGFKPYSEGQTALSEDLKALAEACRPAYEHMASHRLMKA